MWTILYVLNMHKILFYIVELATGRSLNNFSSANSEYRKIVGSANNFSHYASKCTGELSILYSLERALILIN